ncbi:allophanate hydrolase-related protein [Sulfitobacter sp. M13]
MERLRCIPPPLLIGTIDWSARRQVKGFICEDEDVAYCSDISQTGVQSQAPRA